MSYCAVIHDRLPNCKRVLVPAVRNTASHIRNFTSFINHLLSAVEPQCCHVYVLYGEAFLALFQEYISCALITLRSESNCIDGANHSSVFYKLHLRDLSNLVIGICYAVRVPGSVEGVEGAAGESCSPPLRDMEEQKRTRPYQRMLLQLPSTQSNYFSFYGTVLTLQHKICRNQKLDAPQYILTGFRRGYLF